MRYIGKFKFKERYVKYYLTKSKMCDIIEYGLYCEYGICNARFDGLSDNEEETENFGKYLVKSKTMPCSLDEVCEEYIYDKSIIEFIGEMK